MDIQLDIAKRIRAVNIFTLICRFSTLLFAEIRAFVILILGKMMYLKWVKKIE